MPLTVEYVLEHGIYVFEPYNYVFLRTIYDLVIQLYFFFIPDELADKYKLPLNAYVEKFIEKITWYKIGHFIVS
jgi:hypothetical protein